MSAARAAVLLRISTTQRQVGSVVFPTTAIAAGAPPAIGVLRRGRTREAEYITSDSHRPRDPNLQITVSARETRDLKSREERELVQRSI